MKPTYYTTDNQIFELFTRPLKTEVLEKLKEKCGMINKFEEC